MIWLPPTFPISHLHAHSPARVQGLWSPALPHSSMTLYTLYLCSDPLRPFAYLSRFAHISRLRSTVISSRVFFALPLTSPVCIRCCLGISRHSALPITLEFITLVISHLHAHLLYIYSDIVSSQGQGSLTFSINSTYHSAWNSRYSISVC